MEADLWWVFVLEGQSPAANVREGGGECSVTVLYGGAIESVLSLWNPIINVTV